MSFNVLWILVVMFFVGIQVFTASLVYRDAREKKLAAEGWTAMNVFLPFIGILIYFVLNPRSISSGHPETGRPSPPPNPTIISPNTDLGGTARQATVPQEDTNKTILVTKKHKTGPTIIAELIVQKGPRQGQRYEVKDGETWVGSSPENRIVIDEETVSKKQAIIQKEGETFTLINISRSNKTKVNGQEVGYQEIKDNDTIQMGNVVLLFWKRKITAGNEAKDTVTGDCP